jgi:hypothetical protein
MTPPPSPRGEGRERLGAPLHLDSKLKYWTFHLPGPAPADIILQGVYLDLSGVIGVEGSR